MPITVTDRFSLAAHRGPYEGWPSRTRLLRDGQPTRTELPGFVLKRQYAVPSGFLLVTDCDCPYEEITYFCLLDEGLGLVSCRWVGVPYSSCWLSDLAWDDDRTFTALISRELAYRFRIRSWSVPYLRPRLAMRRMASPGVVTGGAATGSTDGGTPS